MRRTLSLFVAFLLLAPVLIAQQGTSEIKGRVSAGDGSVLPGVSVTIKHQESGVVRTTITDKDGVYFMSGVTPGTYELRLFTNNGYTRLATGNPFTVN